jgi:hypothetical protein
MKNQSVSFYDLVPAVGLVYEIEVSIRVYLRLSAVALGVFA